MAQPFGNLFQTLKQGGMPQPRAFPANQFGPALNNAPLGKGSLITFNYMFYKNDQSPLLLITDVMQNYVRGLNLHYLTFPYVKNLLQNYCDNKGFGYLNIRNDEFLVSSFRQYKRTGIRQIRKLDCAFLLNVLASVRTFDPSEVEAIRNSVRQQLQKLTNPVATEQVNPQPPQ